MSPMMLSRVGAAMKHRTEIVGQCKMMLARSAFHLW
jgi:hypothetical protein